MKSSDSYVSLSTSWTCDGRENDAHDAQWAYSGDALWQADGYTVIKKYDAATGRELAEFAEHRVEDPNHVQLIEEDSLAFVSSRSTNGIVKEDAATGDVVWVLGGEHGKFDIVDERGHNHTAGSNYFLGQHNAEYFGDDEYCLFDNQKGSAKSSRLLCLRLDEAEGVATVTFIYSLGSKTPHFGDNDRLTTGNQLGIFWADKIKVHDQYSVRAIEVARNTSEIAWEMKVYGAKCSGKRYCSDPGGGWYAYSIERVYEAPIVANVRCDGETITFDAYNTFKQMNTFPGTYTITAAVGDDDDGTVTGDFDFEAHWRAASVSVDVPFDTSSAEITITNQFGESTTAATGC